jgi:hypothetical protein
MTRWFNKSALAFANYVHHCGSTRHWEEFVWAGTLPPNVDVLNHDHVVQRYQRTGTTDFQKAASRSANAFVNGKLSANLDFGIELNLGLAHHYNLLR